MNSLPDWKLPVGISRQAWVYVNDPHVAAEYDERLAATPLFECDVRTARSLFQPAGSLVDLGCGTGRLLVPFAAAGYEGLGVDLSIEMLRIARQKARAASVDCPLVLANLVELDCLRDASFDYAACLFSTLGMITGAANRRLAIAHFFRILKPRGRLLLHVHNVWFHLFSRAGRRWLVADRWRRFRGNPEAGDFELPGPTALPLHHYSRREVIRELQAVGFRRLAIEPVSLRKDGKLPVPWFLPGFRAYGFLVSAARG
jgi:SAM-dependent methyltransferase